LIGMEGCVGAHHLSRRLVISRFRSFKTVVYWHAQSTWLSAVRAGFL
jgi:hypothetical protein